MDGIAFLNKLLANDFFLKSVIHVYVHVLVDIDTFT